jgi:hypothetical protein
MEILFLYLVALFISTGERQPKENPVEKTQPGLLPATHAH